MGVFTVGNGTLYFETPRTLAHRMVELAEIPPVAKVLEPSAGLGAIARAVRRERPEAELHLIENDPMCVRFLEKAQLGRVHPVDFLRLSGFASYFDRVLMNPPFEEGKWAFHVVNAHAAMKPAGRLVAVLPSDFETVEFFKRFLEGRGVYFENVKPGTFAWKGEHVETTLLVLQGGTPIAPVGDWVKAWKPQETS